MIVNREADDGWRQLVITIKMTSDERVKLEKYLSRLNNGLKEIQCEGRMERTEEGFTYRVYAVPKKWWHKLYKVFVGDSTYGLVKQEQVIKLVDVLLGNEFEMFIESLFEEY